MSSTLQFIIAQIWPGKPTFTEKDIPSQAGKVFIVTGGSAELGFELVKILLQKGAKFYILTCSESKAKAAIETIKSETPIPIVGANVKFIYSDVADLATVKPAAEVFAALEDKLDVLWNNAGIGAAP